MLNFFNCTLVKHDCYFFIEMYPCKEPFYRKFTFKKVMIIIRFVVLKSIMDPVSVRHEKWVLKYL